MINQFQMLAPDRHHLRRTAKATYLYSYVEYDNAFRFMKMGYASSLSWFMFVIMLTSRSCCSDPPEGGCSPTAKGVTSCELAALTARDIGDAPGAGGVAASAPRYLVLLVVSVVFLFPVYWVFLEAIKGPLPSSNTRRTSIPFGSAWPTSRTRSTTFTWQGTC